MTFKHFSTGRGFSSRFHSGGLWLIRHDAALDMNQLMMQLMDATYGCFQKLKVPQNGWFIMETPIKMDDLGGTPIFGNTHMVCSQLLVLVFENLRLRLTRMVSSRCAVLGFFWSMACVDSPDKKI